MPGAPLPLTIFLTPQWAALAWKSIGQSLVLCVLYHIT